MHLSITIQLLSHAPAVEWIKIGCIINFFLSRIFHLCSKAYFLIVIYSQYAHEIFSITRHYLRQCWASFMSPYGVLVHVELIIIAIIQQITRTSLNTIGWRQKLKEGVNGVEQRCYLKSRHNMLQYAHGFMQCLYVMHVFYLLIFFYFTSPEASVNSFSRL